MATNQAKTNELALTEEVNTLLPLVEKFASLFPAEANKEEDTRLIMNFALALSGVKTKTGQKAVAVCSKESIVQCGLDILSKKLDLSKNQVYLIAYGDKLQLQDSYFGKVSLVKRELGIDIRGVVIHEGDVVDITVDESGLKHISQKTKWENFAKKITGAYATAVDKDGKLVDSDIMTFNEIWTSWLQSQGGVKDTHKKFPNEMARKTVEGRLAKHIYQKYSENATINYEDVDIEEPNDNQNVVNIDDNVIDVDPTPANDSAPTNDFVQYEEPEPQFETPTYNGNNDYDYDNVVPNNLEPNTPYQEPQEANAAPQESTNKIFTFDELNAMQHNTGDTYLVKYGDAKNLVATRLWKIVPQTYNPDNKTVIVERA